MIVSRKRFILVQIFAIIILCIILLTTTKYQPKADILFIPETFNQIITTDHQTIDMDLQTVTIDLVILLQCKKILQEMEKFEYPSGRFGVDAKKLTDLTPETNGNPIRSVIISTWRSGSTFLGEILNTMPGNYYHYEPLLNFGIKQIRGPPNGAKAIWNVKKLLNCDYSDMKEYLNFGKRAHRLLSVNQRLWKHYKDHKEFCWKSKFLTPFCKLFPLQSMKVVRLRLELAQQLLDDTRTPQAYLPKIILNRTHNNFQRKPCSDFKLFPIFPQATQKGSNNNNNVYS